MDKDDVNSAHEDDLLNEEVDDVTGETKNGNDALIALLQTMNKTMTNMSELLRTLHTKGETQTSKRQNLPKNANANQQGMTVSQRNRTQMPS